MDLYIFPQSAALDNGYGLAINSAYLKLAPKRDDLIVWYTNDESFLLLRENDIIINRPSYANPIRFYNVFLNKPSTQPLIKSFYFLKDSKFDNIHCDEVIFYDILRHYFPNQHINLRFHNCYARIRDRSRLLNRKMDFKFNLLLKAFYRLEQRIFNDRNLTKIFISKEDCAYYISTTGYKNDSIIWDVYVDEDKVKKVRKVKQLSFEKKIIWLGGVDTHKKKSIKWFISEVLPQVKKEIPNVEFHLFGKGTSQFDQLSKNIFGHGYYDKKGLPFGGVGLYVNPDIIGGGVKIKLTQLLETGIPFISSSFGYEGYDDNLIDNKFCNVVAEDAWSETIIFFFQNYK